MINGDPSRAAHSARPFPRAQVRRTLVETYCVAGRVAGRGDAQGPQRTGVDRVLYLLARDITLNQLAQRRGV